MEPKETTSHAHIQRQGCGQEWDELKLWENGTTKHCFFPHTPIKGETEKSRESGNWKNCTKLSHKKNVNSHRLVEMRNYWVDTYKNWCFVMQIDINQLFNTWYRYIILNELCHGQQEYDLNIFSHLQDSSGKP